MVRKKHYTKEQEKWLRSSISQYDSFSELTNAFNKHFNEDRKVTSVQEKCNKRLKLKINKNAGRFKDRNRKEQLPIGTIRKGGNGSVYIKVKDSFLSYQSGYEEPYWLPIQKKVWQDHYGDVPDGKMVIFLDGNRENLDINNLYCIDRRISAIMAKNRWYMNNREHTLTAIKWCELHYALKEDKQ